MQSDTDLFTDFLFLILLFGFGAWTLREFAQFIWTLNPVYLLYFVILLIPTCLFFERAF